MDKETRRKLSMAARALDFATANPSDQASIKTVVARLDTLVNEAEDLAVQQRNGAISQQLAIAQRQAIRRTARKEQLTQLSRLAASAAKEHPELKALFRVPDSEATNRTFRVAAQDILAAATAQKPLLASLGMGETVIDDLTQSIAAIDTATEAAHAGRRTRVGASAQLPDVVQDAVRTVGVLDALYQVRFKNDPDLLAAWVSASNVHSSPKKKADPAPPAPPAGDEKASKK